MTNPSLDQEYIFPAWVEAYQNDPNISEKLQRVRAVHERRACGNQQLPQISLDSDFQRCFNIYLRMRDAEANRLDLPLEKAYQAHAACLKVFTPVVHRAFWARWLYLERAFELASKTGDLLFGAIVLRTMAEDVWAIRELASLENMLYQNHACVVPEDFKRIRAHGDLLWGRFLPPVGDLPELPESSAPEPFNRPEYADLKQAFQQLNDYVHLNYGSHLLSLFPERTSALRVLLEAYITIYEAFFKVPWVSDPVPPPVSALPPLVVRPWSEEVEFLQRNTLPEIQRHRVERGLATPYEDPAPHLKRWISWSQEVDLQLVWKEEPEWFGPIRPLAEFVLQQTGSDRDFCELLMGRTDVGLPPRLLDFLTFRGARHQADLLEQSFPFGRPSPEQSPLEWFRFTERAIELLLTTTQHKMTLMSWALIRQLNDRNPIGSLLAMRSLIEHYAVALYVGKRLNKTWEEVLKRGTSGRLPINWLVELERDIARFLAGTKGTQEYATRWKAQWTELDLDQAMNLRSATEKGLKQDVLGYLYNFGSDVLHGRKARGIELLSPNREAYLKANLSSALLSLELLLGIDRQVDIIREAIRVLMALRALRQALEKPSTNCERVIRTALVRKNKLTYGRDYMGKGTLDDPFVFAEGIEYYEAFGRLCSQLGLNPQQRQVKLTEDGRVLDVVTRDDHEYYFLVPLQCTSE